MRERGKETEGERNCVRIGDKRKKEKADLERKGLRERNFQRERIGAESENIRNREKT